jgi:TPR repeat protein
MSRFVAFAVVAGVTLSMVGASACGPKAGPGPNPPTPINGLRADVVSTYAEPLIVDWESDQRADLEALTRKGGIAVVRYQKNAIKMLKDCSLEGGYGYVGVTPKEDIIRYDSMDEVAANLPGIFAAGGAQLGAEMQKGSTIDIGWVIVGKKTADRPLAKRSELKGECEGATHFVRGATIGAFAVQSGERSKVSTVASLFGAGGSFKTGSSKLVGKKDGELASCKASSTEAPKPPEGCGALWKIELRPFDEPKKAATKDEKGSLVKTDDIPECDSGFVWDGKKCASKATAKAFACSGRDEGQCRSQCEKSNAKSCTQLARIYRNAGKDPIQAVEFFKKACGLGDEAACAEHGWHLLNGIDVNADKFKAFEAFEKACNAGDGLGCSFLAGMHRSGAAPEATPEKAFNLFKRACNGGLSEGCVELGTMYEKGVGTPRDAKKALTIYERACRAENPDGCAHQGSLFTNERRGAGLDRQKAISLFKSACDKGSALGCTELGNMYFGGAGMEREKQSENDAEAAKLYEKACKMWGGAEGCARLGNLMIKGWGVKRDTYNGVLNIEKGCAKGSGHACAELGKVYQYGVYKPRDAVKAYEYYQKSCSLFEGEGCRLIAQLYRGEAGAGVARDDKRSHDFYEKGCRTGHLVSCHQVAVDLYNGAGVKPDYARALTHYENACTGGYAKSCNEVGFLYDKGQGGVKQDKVKAAQWFEKGCEWGDGWSCENLGRYIEAKIHKAPSQARALDLFGKACEAAEGDPTACARLANRYFNGVGVEKDPMKGIQYLRRGCEVKRDKHSCSQLGELYRSSRYGVSTNFTEALKYFDRACSSRVESACDAKADMYAAGQGVAPNPTEAARIRKESCDRGNTIGCRNLAKMYRDGIGVPKKDPAMAATLHDKACLMRSNADCYELALMYDKGEGVKAEGKKVAELFQRACAFGNYEACANMGYFMYRGSADQKKDTTLGLSKLRSGCSNYSWRFKDEKDKVKNVWSCGALKKLNQKLEAPAAKPTPGYPPSPAPPPGYYGGGTQKM